MIIFTGIKIVPQIEIFIRNSLTMTNLDDKMKQMR